MTPLYQAFASIYKYHCVHE
ncbi:hypothetical protein Tsp_03262, partial [Trichinella spiralis]